MTDQLSLSKKFGSSCIISQELSEITKLATVAVNSIRQFVDSKVKDLSKNEDLELLMNYCKRYINDINLLSWDQDKTLVSDFCKYKTQKLDFQFSIVKMLVSKLTKICAFLISFLLKLQIEESNIESLLSCLNDVSNRLKHIVKKFNEDIKYEQIQFVEDKLAFQQAKMFESELMQNENSLFADLVNLDFAFKKT